jgi:Transposase DDE domain group 1
MGVARQPFQRQGGTHKVSEQSIVGKVGKYNVCFREVTLSSHAGLALLDEFAQQLGVAQVLDEELHVKRRERGYREGDAVLSLSHNLIIGGSCLLDLDVLRGDVGTRQLLGQARLMAPTTAGEFLRKFDIGDIHDLSRAQQRLQARVRPHQAATCCTLDVDSSVYPQASSHKQGSVKAYNGEVGYHPFFVFWAEESELVFSHLRRGSAYTSSKFAWCLKATLKRLPADLPKKLRADSGLYDRQVVAFCETHHLTFGITADQTAPLLAAIAAIPEAQWQDLAHYDLAQVAEFRYCPQQWPQAYRYIVKRELRENKQHQLYFQYHVFVTNDETSSTDHLLEWHLQHAAMENLIKEHKHGFSLEKLPTQNFHANWAYLLIGQLAFNLVAWFKKLILPPDYHQATVKTIRHHVLNVAGKIVRTARQFFLVISDEYRYQAVWRFALAQLTQLKFG